MTIEDRQKLREAAKCAARARREPSAEPAPWKLQTSNSFRRIGMHGDGDVLCATAHQYDRHPDLRALPCVLEYIIAAQPRVVLELLDELDELDKKHVEVIEALRADVERMRPSYEIGLMYESRVAIDGAITAQLAKRKGP